MNGLARYCVGLAGYQQPGHRDAVGACDVARDLAISERWREAMTVLEAEKTIELPNFGRVVQQLADDTIWAHGLSPPKPVGRRVTDYRRPGRHDRRLDAMRTALMCRASNGSLRDFGVESYYDLPPRLFFEMHSSEREGLVGIDASMSGEHPDSPLCWYFLHRYGRPNHVLLELDWDRPLRERVEALRTYQELGIISPEEIRRMMFDER